MSHKVDPRIYRIKNISDWKTRGYYKNPSQYLEEDFRIREFLNKKIGKLVLERVEIERFPNNLNIIIFTSRPGLIIGRGGEGIEQLKKELEKEIFEHSVSSGFYSKGFKKKEKKQVKSGQKKKKDDLGLRTDSREIKNIKIEIREVKNPWLSAKLSASWIAQQLEKRVRYRKVIKQALSKISSHKEVRGVRIEVSGRLDGNEIARKEWISSGRFPRQTLRSDIDYAKDEAHCVYGTIGVKVWIYKGEKF